MAPPRSAYTYAAWCRSADSTVIHHPQPRAPVQSQAKSPVSENSSSSTTDQPSLWNCWYVASCLTSLSKHPPLPRFCGARVGHQFATDDGEACGAFSDSTEHSVRCRTSSSARAPQKLITRARQAPGDLSFGRRARLAASFAGWVSEATLSSWDRRPRATTASLHHCVFPVVASPISFQPAKAATRGRSDPRGLLWHDINIRYLEGSATYNRQRAGEPRVVCPDHGGCFMSITETRRAFSVRYEMRPVGFFLHP